MATRTRTGRVSKPPERLELFEDVEDDYTDDDEDYEGDESDFYSESESEDEYDDALHTSRGQSSGAQK